MAIDKNTKGQAAIEFMVTYGWAILAALLVIGALAYFGITNPGLPDKCIFSNAFSCGDYIIQEDSIRIRLTNTVGQTIYGNAPDNITAIMTDSGNPCAVSGPSGANPDTLEPEAVLNIMCDISATPFDEGDKVKVKLTITYAKSPSGYDQVSLGELYTTVQP